MTEEILEEKKYKRHWSFIVCDKRYLYPMTAIVLMTGIAAAIILKDPNQINRIGSFIIGIGVWMSMRFTLREGLLKYNDAADDHPVYPSTNKLNANYFNKLIFAGGDERLKLHGFFLVILGSVLGSYGDLIIRQLLPNCF